MLSRDSEYIYEFNYYSKNLWIIIIIKPMQKDKQYKKSYTEQSFIILISVLFLLSFSSILTSGNFMLTHDSIDWYGVFQYFAESIYNNSWPFWNIYTHTGEPFYYNYVQIPLLEPITLTIIFIGKLFKIDILTVYHWNFFIQLLLMNLGIYLFLRKFYKHFSTKIILYIVISFSSLQLICMRLIGIWQIFHLTPWILLFIFKLFEENNNRLSWILLATFIGISLHGISAVYNLSFLFIFLATFLVKNRAEIKKMTYIFRIKQIQTLILLALIIISLSSPLLTTILFDLKKFVPVARTIDARTSQSFFMSIDQIASGEKIWKGATNIRDFIGLINPFSPYALLHKWYNDYLNTNDLTESFLYIGILPFAFAIYGIFFSKHKYKINFLILLISLGLLMLGANFIFFKLFALVFPVIRFIRHAMQFLPFFLLALFYFSGLGIDRFIDKYTTPKHKSDKFFTKRLLLEILIGCLSVFILTIYHTKNNFGMDIKILTYFYLLCAGFLWLIRHSTVIGRYTVLLLIVFIISDLFIFNYSNRPLTIQPRRLSFSTQSEKFEFEKDRIYNILHHSEIPRFKSILFRRHAIDKNYNTDQCSFFELKYFNALTYIPQNNLEVIAGVSEPIIRFYSKAMAYKDEHFNEYFKNQTEEKFLKNILFINDNKEIKDDLLYSHERDKTANNSFGYKVMNYNPNNLKIEVNSKNKGFLYFSDGYDGYWKAYLDSKPTALYRANINFKAIMLPEGTHIVEFIYKPFPHIMSLYIYSLTLVGILSYVLYVAYKRIP